MSYQVFEKLRCDGSEESQYTPGNVQFHPWVEVPSPMSPGWTTRFCPQCYRMEYTTVHEKCIPEVGQWYALDRASPLGIEARHILEGQGIRTR
jgi:hypothetical protein